MDDRWRKIEGEDHVLALNDYSSLKIGKYRQEIEEQFQTIAQSLSSQSTKQIALAKLAQAQTVLMQFQQIDWICSPLEGIDCEILFLGEEHWQKGKLRIKVSIDFPENSNTANPVDNIFSEPNNYNFSIAVLLEFLSSEITSAETQTEEGSISIELKKIADNSINSPHFFTFKSNSQ
jgi:hypothetical protein